MADKITLILDTHLRIPSEQIGYAQLLGLTRITSIENEEKARAIAEHVWGAKKLPDTYPLLEKHGGYINMPRGFLTEVIKLLKEADAEYEIQDKRNTTSDIRLARGNSSVVLREDQTAAVRSIRSSEQGIINAQPGRGKTVIALASICDIKQKTLIIVDKANIAKQWKERAKEHFDLDIGLIGDKEWEEKDITVAIQQTLWSRREELQEQGWFEKWGYLIIDECHHLPALTFYDIVSRFPAKYRIGLSATVGKTPAKEKTALLTLGPIIHKDETLDVQPKIVKVETGFKFK
jgi:superfamily II DNA or RNA helicase